MVVEVFVGKLVAYAQVRLVSRGGEIQSLVLLALSAGLLRSRLVD
jgi:hypothetical protein